MDDPRLTPARPDLAHEALRGRVAAARFAAPSRRVVAVPAAPLTDVADAEAPLASQLLLGEAFEVLESRDGWAWGQTAADGYVGYVPAACLRADAPAPTHRVRALAALCFPAPDIKRRPLAALPFGARVAAVADAPGFLALADGGYARAVDLAPADDVEPDWVAVAERFVGQPYLWGGRGAGGVDCSGLVQISRQAAGFACPRDSDMQEVAPGRDVARLRRGDVVFWDGHVGVMISPTRLLHANATAMAATVEPLAQAEARIAAAEGPVRARRRWVGRT